MSAYVKAGAVTIIIFFAGILFGMWLDSTRLSSVRQALTKIETDWNDARLLSQYFQNLGVESCQAALEQNLAFNQRIYQDGLNIEKAIQASGLTAELEQEQRRYVLLQTTFWINSIELKNRCNFDYSNVVHLFKLKDLSREESLENKLQSSIMLDLKEKCGNKIMLIPLAADLNLTITDAIVKQHDIKRLPAVIIDSEKVFQGLTGFEQLNEITKC